MRRSAKWRQEKATPNQKAWLRSRLNKAGKLPALESYTTLANTLTMTKGQAGDLIIRIKHGALVSHLQFIFYDVATELKDRDVTSGK